MKTERILLSLLAVVIGLLVAGIAFFVYENTRTNRKPQTKTASVLAPTPTLKPAIFLTLDQPKDEEVVTNRNISVSGKTANDAIVVVLTNSEEQVLVPKADGNFSTTVALKDGQNLIETTAIAENGESESVLRVVTFTTEEF